MGHNSLSSGRLKTTKRRKTNMKRFAYLFFLGFWGAFFLTLAVTMR
ncbi:MAG: hypothetical protein ABSG75_15785 [Syntrophales bacterium]